MYALITGASQGLGRSFAEQLAQQKYNVILVALPTIELELTAEFIRNKYAVKVETLGIDLTDPEAIDKIYKFSSHFPVRILINNAGLGYTHPFETLDPIFLDKLIKLNIWSITHLTHKFLPLLRKNTPAYILNVSSMAGLLTMPYKTAYSASKKYVYAFSIGLNEELKGSGISVTALCPGGIHTPAVAATIEKLGKTARRMTALPQEIAQEGLKAMFARKGVSVPKLFPKVYASLRYLVPISVQVKMIGGFFRKKYSSS